MIHKRANYPCDMFTFNFTGMRTGKRLGAIRKKLEDMYKDRGWFTRSWVVKNCRAKITYQGLKFMEENDTEPSRDKVEALAELYNIPSKLLQPTNLSTLAEAMEVQSILIGSKEDQQSWFDDYEHQWGRYHMSDPRFKEYLENTSLQPENFYEIEPEYNDDNTYSMEDISIELVMRVYQNKTGFQVMERTVHKRTELSKDDIEVLETIIRQQTKIVSDYHKRLKDAQELHLKDGEDHCH